MRNIILKMNLYFSVKMSSISTDIVYSWIQPNGIYDIETTI